jgi:hypothetical protein
MLAGPSHSLDRRQAAAISPALLGRAAAASMMLTRERFAVGRNRRQRYGNAEAQDKVLRNRKDGRRATDATRMPTPMGENHGTSPYADA